MLAPSDPARYYFVELGVIKDPVEAGVYVYTDSGVPSSLYNPFSFPSTLVLPDATTKHFSSANSDADLAAYGIYRLWEDTPAQPDAESLVLVSGALNVNTVDGRVERVDSWTTFSPEEILAYRMQLYEKLKGEKARREGLVNEHLAVGGSDGIDVLEAVLKASRDIATNLTEQFAAWVRANTALTPPTFSLTNGNFTAVLRRQALLASLLDIRAAFIALRNQLAAFTLMSELITFEPEITNDLNWP